MNDDLMENNIFGMLGFLSDTGNPDAKIMFAVFVVFIIVAYKALGVLKNTIIVSVISACFPFVLDKVLGFDIDITLDLILFYVVCGVVLYLLYEVIKVFYKTSKVFMDVVGILMFPFVLVLKFLGWLFGFEHEKKGKKDRKKKKKHSDEEEE
ncbi:MAG: hypothetical protein DRN71_02485 [Candidatus Nanohalarchaeota archaeon]|nr:MAG: hypothetical protein DRN71_02485 [Candidatus Nanohaloarchaeota archaeon]